MLSQKVLAKNQGFNKRKSLPKARGPIWLRKRQNPGLELKGLFGQE